MRAQEYPDPQEEQVRGEKRLINGRHKLLIDGKTGIHATKPPKSQRGNDGKTGIHVTNPSSNSQRGKISFDLSLMNGKDKDDETNKRTVDLHGKKLIEEKDMETEETDGELTPDGDSSTSTMEL